MDTLVIKAYSYVRCSTTEQLKGDSIRRQNRLAEDYCNKHNLELDKTLSFKDLGVSAFKSDNLISGNLGILINCIETGIIKQGEYILIENFDRASRAHILDSFGLFTRLLNLGVFIVTLADERIYSRENSSDIGAILFSIITMVRANEESLTKSKRLKASWENRRNLAKTETILTRKNPAWLRLIDNQLVVMQDRAEIIKLIFKLTIDGYGQHMIVKHLNENGIESFGDGERKARKSEGWQSSYICKLQHDGKVLGHYTPGIMIDGKRVLQEPIPNYYPQIIDNHTWDNAQLALKSRMCRGGKPGGTINILQGLLKCGCGGPLVRINKGKRSPGVKLYCDRSRRALSNCKGWLKYDDVELNVLSAIKELDIQSIINQDLTISQSLRSDLNILVNRRNTLEEQLNNLTMAIAEGGPISVLVKKIKEVGVELEKVQALLEEGTERLKDLEKHSETVRNNITEISELMVNATEQDRMRVRTIIRSLISKITLHLSVNKILIDYHSSETITGKHIVRFENGTQLVFDEDEKSPFE